MVHQAPAAILADGLGAQRGTAARHAKIAGADYASYPSSATLHRGRSSAEKTRSNGLRGQRGDQGTLRRGRHASRAPSPIS
jgi:hypothetical protein